jgi:hypothetical protein
MHCRLTSRTNGGTCARRERSSVTTDCVESLLPCRGTRVGVVRLALTRPWQLLLGILAVVDWPMDFVIVYDI